MLPVIVLSCLLCLAVAVVGALRVLRGRGMGRWLVTYVREAPKRSRHPRPHERGGAETHVLIGVMDHYEPQWGQATPELARDRVRQWVENYPRLFGAFRD